MLKVFKKKKKANIVDFKLNHPYEKRVAESDRIICKYPERVPIICQRINNEVPEIDRSKYLCPRDLSMANFMLVIRKRLQLSPEKGLYLFVANKIVPCTQLLGTVYEQKKDEDGFLYINYAGESTFG